MGKDFHDVAKSKGFCDKHRDPLQVLFLIMSEAAEAGEEYREGFGFNEIYYAGPKPMGFSIEMADIIIRTLEACVEWNIDIEEAIRIKHEYNKTRPHMHGRKC